MSNFRNLIETVLTEIDYDDPTERYWDRSPVNVDPDLQKNILYSKPINPVKKDEPVYIKIITTEKYGNSNTKVVYLKSNKTDPFTNDKSQASRFKLADAEIFVNKHPKKDIMISGVPYERHLEIEKC